MSRDGRGAAAAAALPRDRWIVASALGAVVALAWAYQLYMAWGMEHVSPWMSALMPDMSAWRARDLARLLVMWVVMMAAMMLPSVAPMVVAFVAVHRHRHEGGSLLATSLFVAGYLAAWTAFSAVATLAQWQLHRMALVSSAMVATSSLLSGGLLVATGVFQLTPFKDACLTQCRSPLGFMLTRWRDGLRGALSMGAAHGAYCVGCCALLMALLFVNGVMNVAWMAALTAFVLVEKLAPAHAWTRRLAGITLCAWGVAVAVGG